MVFGGLELASSEGQLPAGSLFQDALPEDLSPGFAPRVKEKECDTARGNQIEKGSKSRSHRRSVPR